MTPWKQSEGWGLHTIEQPGPYEKNPGNEKTSSNQVRIGILFF